MRTKWLFLSCVLFLLSACGPMMGSMMVASNGVKNFDVVHGQLQNLQPGTRLAVLGPFATTPSSFEICRGEEAAIFTSTFNQTGLFTAELAMSSRLVEDSPQVADWRGQTAAAIQQKLALQKTPDFLMSAVILYREMVPAPTKGIVMKVGYRLDFLALKSGQESSVEIQVQEMFQAAVPAAVDALAGHLVNQ